MIVSDLTWHDTETGLTWELKTPENKNDRFVWSQEFVMSSELDAHSYAETLNSQSFGGFNDWRLPTLDELKDLFSKKDNLKVFSSGGYWSSTTYESYKNGAWYVYFNDGDVYGSYKYTNFYVRCVRAGE